MLSPDNYCSLPSTNLQPWAPPYIVRIPAPKFIYGRTVPTSSGYGFVVFYDVQNEIWWASGEPQQIAWQTPDGKWTHGPITEWQRQAEQLPWPVTDYRTLALPRYPILPTVTQPIPRSIHQIWIGTSMPNQRIVNTLAHNAKQTSGYELILHVDVSDELFASLTSTMKTSVPGLSVVKLNGTDFFEQFKKSPIYSHYLNATTGTATNYSAASDMLRYPLANHHGGIYMDVDDYFLTPIAEQTFMAAANDVLLGPLINHYAAGFLGYNTSTFATPRNNPVMSRITEEMLSRCNQHSDFFIQPRPTFADQYSPEYKSYSTELFRLTGPQLFNDVLARERPDYYRTMFNLSDEHGTKAQHGVIDSAYDQKLTRVAEHYFPFSTRSPVEIGQEHSWETT